MQYQLHDQLSMLYQFLMQMGLKCWYTCHTFDDNLSISNSDVQGFLSIYFVIEQVTQGHFFLSLLGVSQVCYLSMDIPIFLPSGGQAMTLIKRYFHRNWE